VVIEVSATNSNAFSGHYIYKVETVHVNSSVLQGFSLIKKLYHTIS